MKRTIRVPVLAGVAIALASAHLPAQSQAPRSSSLQVAVGTAVAQPGTEVHLPVTLRKGAEKNIVKVTSRLRFPKTLTFVEAEPGLGAEIAQGQVKAELSKQEYPNHRVLELTVTAKGPLPDSVLTVLIFEVSTEVRVGSHVKVDNLQARAWSQANKEIQPASAQGGTVLVVETLFVPSCFFYMH
ncbi:MAG: hypothetical protein HY315_09025 [Acidobacteria bacterium]|nr:hypothetical protein [Acidobacteriota bacterium]